MLRDIIELLEDIGELLGFLLPKVLCVVGIVVLGHGVRYVLGGYGFGYRMSILGGFAAVAIMGIVLDALFSRKA